MAAANPDRQTDRPQPNMTADITTFVFLLLLHLKCEAGVATKRTLATDLGATHDNSLLCLEENMSVYISKEKFPDLPLCIYVGGEPNTNITVRQTAEVLIPACIYPPQMNAGAFTRLLQ